MTADIFLSYNREDQAVAKRFAEAFEAAGLSVWWDATLRSGEAYDRVTEEALRTARAVVVLWSPRSIDSRWVRAEASIADENGTLVPAKIEACQLPVMFRLTQTADLSHWRGEVGDGAWLAFLADVRRKVGYDGSATVQPAPISAKPPVSGGMPVVAVLPIQYRGGERELEFLAEDLTEDITRELGQSFYCKVIAASTMATWRGRPADHRALQHELGTRYAVEGRLQDSGANVRLTVQLIDAETDSTLWSSRFAGKLDENHESPERLALSVAIELDQNIGKNEFGRAISKRPPCSAWEHCLRSWAIGGLRGQGYGQEGVEESRRAIAAAPDYGLAHALLASALASRTQVDRRLISDAERQALIRESHDAIQRAIRLDSSNPIVLTQLATAYGMLGDAEAGLRLAQRATMLAPNAAEAQYALGFANFMLGRPAEVIKAIGKEELIGLQNSIGLSNNIRWGTQAQLAICLFIEGRSAEAEAAIDDSLMLQPTYYLSIRWKAIIAADLGKEGSARASIRLLRQTEPGKSIEEYLDSPKHLPIEHPRKYEAIEILRRLLEESEQGE
jgi:TolB-like protein